MILYRDLPTKDINVVDWFHSFESFVEQKRKSKKKEHKKEIVERFLNALGDLKYMGIISESGRGTYIFKKNYFGKNLQFTNLV